MENQNEKKFIMTLANEIREIEVGTFKLHVPDITLKSGMTLYRDDETFDFLGKGTFEEKPVYWTLKLGDEKASYFSEKGLTSDVMFFRFHPKEIKNFPCFVNPEVLKKELEDHKRKVAELEKTLKLTETAQEKPKKKQKKN